jgi:hypothetical protein
MPARKATASGKWSQSIWDVTPGVGDDVFANNFTIEIDQNVNVGSLRTALSSGYAVAGGGFTLYQPLSVIASVGGFLGGPATCLTSYVSAGTATLSGNIIHTGSGVATVGLLHNSSGNITIYGNISAGNGQQCFGVNNNSNGNISVYGNVFAGPSNQSAGIWNASVGTLYVKGNVTGGAVFNSNAADGISNRSAGTVIIEGNVYGGAGANIPGVFQNSTGTVIISGTITASANAHGVVSSNTTARNEFTGTLVNSISGRQAVYCAKYLVHPKMFDSATVQAVDRAGTYISYFAPEAYSTTFVPHTSSVALGTAYAAVSSLSGVAVNIPVQLSGTMVVPSEASVSHGTLVGQTTGTAIHTSEQLQQVWNTNINTLTAANSLGARLKNTATVQEVGQQIQNFNL